MASKSKESSWNDSIVLLIITEVTVAGGVFIIGGVLQTAAMNKETVFAGRFFAGLGIGMLVSRASILEMVLANYYNRVYWLLVSYNLVPEQVNCILTYRQIISISIRNR